MGALVSVVISTITGVFARFLTVETLKFIAWRAFILSIVVIVLPASLYLLAVKILTEIMDVVIAQTDSFSVSAPLQFSGLGAWMAVKMKLPEAMAIFSECLGLRWAFSFFRR
jgi:hypothetical protein